MTNEELRMQMLAGVITESEYKAKLKENKTATKKKPIKEHFIGMGAINSPFIEREKEVYEDAFEHFLGQKYDLKENEETEDAFSSPSDTNPVVQDYLKQLTDMLNNQTDDTFDLKNLKYAVDKFSNMINDEIAKFEVEEGKEEVAMNENESYQNDNGTKFKKINQNEFDNLNEFGVIGKFTDANGEEFIVNVMYDKADDFDSDEEAKETFNDLFSNPDNFDELLWRSAKEDLGYDTNELKLIDIIPATFL